MKLDARLNAIVSEINGETLYDIGCDHGKVLVTALQEGKVLRATGIDVSEQSLRKAHELAYKCGVSAEFFCADGKNVDFSDCDVLVIAGMGGNEISEMLKDRAFYPKTIVLVPHQDKRLLRRFLNDKKLYAFKDYTVTVRRKFYDIIVVKNGENSEPYSEEELYYGKNSPETDAFYQKVCARAKSLKQISDLHGSVSPELKKEWEAYEKWSR